MDIKLFFDLNDFLILYNQGLPENYKLTSISNKNK